jgi:hypothetical protein
MTLAMCCEIKFLKTETQEELSIYKVSAVTIEKSWKLICGKAEIVFPKKYFDFLNEKERFKRGNKVEIYLGYDNVLNQRFTGYIDRINDDIPTVIKLEDEMWKLKQIDVSYSNQNTNLKKMIQSMVNGFPVDIDDKIQIGAVRFSKMKLGEVLNKLREEPFMLYSFIRNGKLTVYKVHSDVTKEVPTFDLERNCSEVSINYISKADRLLKVILTSTGKMGKIITAEYGDQNPTSIINEKSSYSNLSLEDLKRECKRIYNSSKKDGFNGTFTTFGLIPLQHGQKIKLESRLYPDRKGTYYVDAVTDTFNKETGYKQEVELGQPALSE